jgi:hypothetical protein
MSLVWQLEIDGLKLFTNLSTTEAQCNACNPIKNYKLSNRSPTVLEPHISKHPEYFALWNKLKKQKEEEAKSQQGQLLNYFNNGNFLIKYFKKFFLGISSDDRKVINFIAETNQPLSIVEYDSFKALCNVSNLRSNLILIIKYLFRSYILH